MLQSGMFTHRLATTADMPVLENMMDAAIRELLPEFLSPEKVEASFAVMGVDSQLIADGTYFILESEGRPAGCGGWSRRATLFGHNHTAGREARLLDPATEAARIRAMYTHPDFRAPGRGPADSGAVRGGGARRRLHARRTGRHRGRRAAVSRLRLCRDRADGGAHAGRQ